MIEYYFSSFTNSIKTRRSNSVGSSSWTPPTGTKMNWLSGTPISIISNLILLQRFSESRWLYSGVAVALSQEPLKRIFHPFSIATLAISPRLIKSLLLRRGGLPAGLHRLYGLLLQVGPGRRAYDEEFDEFDEFLEEEEKLERNEAKNRNKNK